MTEVLRSLIPFVLESRVIEVADIQACRTTGSIQPQPVLPSGAHGNIPSKKLGEDRRAVISRRAQLTNHLTVPREATRRHPHMSTERGAERTG